MAEFQLATGPEYEVTQQNFHMQTNSTQVHMYQYMRSRVRVKIPQLQVFARASMLLTSIS